MPEGAVARRAASRGGRARRGAGGARDGAGRGAPRRAWPTCSPRSTTARSATRTRGPLEELLELGLQTGRIRALYGPGRRAGRARPLPPAARAAASSTQSARDVNEALEALAGRALERVDGAARSGPASTASRSRRRTSRSCSASARPARGSQRSARESKKLLHGLPRPRGPALPRRRRRARSGSRRPPASLACGARVTVVSPELDAGFAELDVEWRRAPLRDGRPRRRVPRHRRDRRIARSTSGSRDDAEARAMLCNVADVPELCNFILPAVHREGPIAVAVSTGGASPALAKRLRSQIAELVGPEHADLARGAACAAAPRRRSGSRPTRSAATSSRSSSRSASR